MSVERPSASWRQTGPPRITTRVFADLAIYSCGFGLVIGVSFPYWLRLLSVPADTAYDTTLRMACVFAGLLVGLFSFALARAVVGSRLHVLVLGMRAAREGMTRALTSGDWSSCDDRDCHVPVESRDEIGEAADSHNRLLDAVAAAHSIEHDVSQIVAAMAQPLDLDELCSVALTEVLARTDAIGAAVVVLGGRRIMPTCLSVGRTLTELELIRLAQGLADGEACDDEPGTLLRPLRARDQLVGMLAATTSGTSRLRPTQLGKERLLTVLADALGVALSNALLHEQVCYLATIDELTGLANRRSGMLELDRAVASVIGGGTLGVLMIDIDHFKAVNDGHGHRAGDDALAQVAARCRRALRGEDLLMRYGGEEFLAVLPGLGADELAETAERVRTSVAQGSVTTGDEALGLTVSVGAASVTGPLFDAQPAGTLLARADAALYAAKRAGRNRVVIDPRSGAIPSNVGLLGDAIGVSHV